MLNFYYRGGKMKLKGEMLMLNVLHLENIDLSLLQPELQKKYEEAPQFFAQSPVVVDCALVAEDCEKLDFSALKTLLSDLGFVPVGVRGMPENLNVTAMKAGWAVMRAGYVSVSTASTSSENNKEPHDQSGDASVAQNPVIETVPSIQSVTIDRPVRSGQQIYAANADMTVLSATSAGSELMADGSIHAYGPMRGRVLAGAQGNESARIFCNALQAELIAIAGRYLLLDESDTELKGKPAMIRLEGEKLIIEPLG